MSKVSREDAAGERLAETLGRRLSRLNSWSSRRRVAMVSGVFWGRKTWQDAAEASVHILGVGASVGGVVKSKNVTRQRLHTFRLRISL